MIPKTGEKMNNTVLHAKDDVVCPEGNDKSVGTGSKILTSGYVWHGLGLFTIDLIVNCPASVAKIIAKSM